MTTGLIRGLKGLLLLASVDRPLPTLGHSPEVDKAALHIRADQLHAELVTHIQALETARQSSFNGRMQKTDPRAFRRCAGDNRIELFSNP